MLDILRHMPLGQAFLWFLLENVLILLVSLYIGEVALRRWGSYRVCPPAAPDSLEVRLAACTVFLNTVVTCAGLVLWRHDLIHIRETVDLQAVGDAVVLFVFMDLCMYVLHRMAHLPLLYPWLHATHHRFENPRPLTLFALNPVENLSYGCLWLVVLMVYPVSWFGVTVYLAINVASGLLGHLGVEPCPASWAAHPVLRYVSSSTFHAQHHGDRQHNFGFYTMIWDNVFGTISPTYEERFQRNADPSGSG